MSGSHVKCLRNQVFEFAPFAGKILLAEHNEGLAASLNAPFHFGEQRRAWLEGLEINADFESGTFQLQQKPLANPLFVATAVTDKHVKEISLCWHVSLRLALPFDN